MRFSANDVHTAVKFNDRTPDDDPPGFVLIVVGGTTLIYVASTSVSLGLARRQDKLHPGGRSSLSP